HNSGLAVFSPRLELIDPEGLVLLDRVSDFTVIDIELQHEGRHHLVISSPGDPPFESGTFDGQLALEPFTHTNKLPAHKAPPPPATGAASGGGALGAGGSFGGGSSGGVPVGAPSAAKGQNPAAPWGPPPGSKPPPKQPKPPDAKPATPLIDA